jgi:hypothetical protein
LSEISNKPLHEGDKKLSHEEWRKQEWVSDINNTSEGPKLEIVNESASLARKWSPNSANWNKRRRKYQSDC